MPNELTAGRKPRQSNFEALRIVAMAMIVVCHYCGAGIQYRGHPDAFELFLQGSLSHRLITLFFLPRGSIGVGLFFMLTGFFMCKGEWKPQRLKPLAAQTLFYSLSLLALYVVLKAFGVYSFPYVVNNAAVNISGGGSSRALSIR